MLGIELEGVREYAEGMAVGLARDEQSGRVVVFARNEAGYNNTRVDVLDLLKWLGDHPDWPSLDIPTA